MSEPMIERLQEVWSDITALCRDLTDEQWGLPTDLPGWSVKDNVAHMIGTERMLMGERPEGDPTAEGAHVRNDIGRANEAWVESYRDRPGAEVLAAFEDVTTRRIEQLRELTADDWDREGFTPEGPGPYRQFMKIRVFDCWYHDQDIREAVGRAGFLEGTVADLSIGHIPAKGLPFVVGKKAAAPAGSSVVFEVAGTPSIVATVVVPPEGRAALVEEVPDTPTARIATDRRTFARLAGGRWNGSRARADGTVETEGDQELADRVVDNMAFTI